MGKSEKTTAAEIAESQFVIDPAVTDRSGTIRLSEMFWLFEEMYDIYAEPIGMLLKDIQPTGYTMVIATQHAVIGRLPKANEKITIRAWASDPVKCFCVMNYEALDSEGGFLIGNCQHMAVIGLETRKLIRDIPENISFPIVQTGREFGHPDKPVPVAVTETAPFVVPKEYIDNNGHMNNTHYFDADEIVMTEEEKMTVPREITIRYNSETLLGEDLVIGRGKDGSRHFFEGKRDGKTVYTAEYIY